MLHSSFASAVAIKDLLDATGPNLEHLGIGISDVRGPTDVIKSTEFNLASCTGLRSLRISGSATDRFCTYRLSLSWILILLSTVSSPQIRTLLFSIPVPDLPSVNLGGLAAVLSHERFKSLRRIVFDLKIVTIKSKRVTLDPATEKSAREKLASLPVNLEFHQDL